MNKIKVWCLVYGNNFRVVEKIYIQFTIFRDGNKTKLTNHDSKSKRFPNYFVKILHNVKHSGWANRLSPLRFFSAE